MFLDDNVSDVQKKNGVIIMTEKHVTESYTQEENGAVKKQNGTKLIQTVSVVFLPLLWIGFFYSLSRGNESNMSSYTTIILIFSLINSDILFSRERMPNKVLNVLAKLEGILLVVLAFITIVNIIVK